MKTRGWRQGHQELATTPSGSHQSLSSLHDDDYPHRKHQQQQQHHQSRTSNEYGAVTPSRHGPSVQYILRVHATETL